MPVISLPTQSRFRGALLGGAIGDALGRPAETLSPDRLRDSHGRLTDYVKWQGWRHGPIGTITDDTQMTIVVAKCLIEQGWLDPDDLARRFVKWLPEGRGVGKQTRAAVEGLRDGEPWFSAGEATSGNGAAMRVAPIGLLRWNNPALLRAEAVLSSLPTHRQAMGIAGAIAAATATAYVVACPVTDFDAHALVSAMREAISGIETEALPTRADPAMRTTLYERLAIFPDALSLSPEQFFATYHNGAFVLETLPAALYCFLRSPNDVEATLLLAVNAGYDADTVAAIAGTWGGALMGEEGLPQRLLPELEYQDDLIALADALHQHATTVR